MNKNEIFLLCIWLRKHETNICITKDIFINVCYYIRLMVILREGFWGHC